MPASSERPAPPRAGRPRLSQADHRLMLAAKGRCRIRLSDGRIVRLACWGGKAGPDQMLVVNEANARWHEPKVYLAELLDRPCGSCGKPTEFVTAGAPGTGAWHVCPANHYHAVRPARLLSPEETR